MAVVTYIICSTVNMDTTISRLNVTPFAHLINHSMSLTSATPIMHTNMSTNGNTHDMNVLNMYSLVPNMFMSDAHKKQSNDTIISLLCPNVSSGSTMSNSDDGYDMLKLIDVDNICM